MNGGETLGRSVALLVAVIGAPGGRIWRIVSSFLLAIAWFGFAESGLPQALTGALVTLGLVATAAVAFGWTWPPLVFEALCEGAELGLPAGLFAAFLLRHRGWDQLLFGCGATLAAISVFAAESCRANAEAGWRRAALFVDATLLPPALVFALLSGARAWPNRIGLLAGAAFAVAVLAWVPTTVVEWRRTVSELDEEVRIGLLPDADARVLALPWQRFLEKRFGRADERREYVTSALRLAVARRQQRRRAGEPARLRQLEVITFRTRIRRTLDARNARLSKSSDEYARLEGE